MRKLRWGAAGLAGALLFSYFVRIQVRPPRTTVKPESAPQPATEGSPSRAAEVLRALAQAHSRATAASHAATASPSRAAASSGASNGPSASAATPSANSAPPSWRPATGGEPSTLPTLPPVGSAEWSKGKFTDFTPEELADMAGRCELRWQLPPFFATTPPSFGPDYDRALAAARDRYVAALRALYAEATGDADAAAHLPPRELADAIRRASDGSGLEIQRRLSAARAGDPVALDDSIDERYLELQLSTGDDFERTLAEEVGPDRAHTLRLAAGPKFTLTGCDPAHALYRSQR